MKKTHLAIIGAGTAGITTAILLARQGIHVTIFEKVSALEPVGAGLLLQPSGLAVFEHLDVLEHALKLGAKVTGLEGRLSNHKLLVNSHYHQANPQFYGLGIHRASLCHILETKAREYPDLIHWCMNADIQSYQESQNEVRIQGSVATQNYTECFDAILIANGARSELRPRKWVKIDQAYPWGAKWTIVPECLELDPEILHQFYDRAQIMLGILPTGATPQQADKRYSSVFWSMPTAKLDHFLTTNLEHQQWLQDIEHLWPETAIWLKQVIAEPELEPQWLSAHYRDVVMSKFGEGRVGIIGDAAHAMSPQLGQGANMALLDAWAFGQAVHAGRHGQTLDWTKIWQQYHLHRQSSTQFYQFLSRLLTPFYQSNHWWAGGLRDLTFAWMYQIPYFRKEMALTVSGLKLSIFHQMNYADIAQPYPENIKL